MSLIALFRRGRRHRRMLASLPLLAGAAFLAVGLVPSAAHASVTYDDPVEGPDVSLAEILDLLPHISLDIDECPGGVC